ncbi:hypothetical protein BDW74DRAFT_171075 [Aspergillus multicolor]|uniref:uncharacterized protein n=1 Tax=Aspergillus multicolor TaxID=41759 RepID=UPI003CCE4D94
MAPAIAIATTLARAQHGNARARQLVKAIAKKHGHLGEEILSQMSAEVRREVEEALLRKDEMIGSSVITLAKNLYTSSARFVFELLQNADDNSYTIAKSASAMPFVSFRVYSSRIVLECNEDGFTHENLVAICNVGQSSKTGAEGYIGEKGIGFKSVFMVASKVLIQSSHFSFYFQHRKNDSGMGMISPVWEETDDILDVPLTRITLFLHGTGSPEDLARERQIILQQFQELQATFLLFMKNLRRIGVEIYDYDDENPVSSTAFSMTQQGPDRVQLKKQTVVNGEVQDSSQLYHVAKGTVTDLPPNENRRYTNAELAEATYAKAEVVLAFPLTQDSVPLIEPQDVFAFLPVRKMGFPFLIQSDFVTDASRQDLVRTSARNASLLAAAARVFVLAISQFCHHRTLRFKWTRYLPNDKQQSWDPFWTMFLDAIRWNLKTTPTLWTRSHKKLRCIEDMRRVPSTMKNKYGEPLFPDLDVEKYLAVEYLRKDLDLLAAHGLGVLRKREFLARVRHELEEGDYPIMFDHDTDADWHSRAARVLIECWPQYSDQMKDLSLIPVMVTEDLCEWWDSAETTESDGIFFSKVKGYLIPKELDLYRVHQEAEINPMRRKLFALLGVKEAGGHQTTCTPTLELSKATVTFLYLTAHLDHDNDYAEFYKHIKLLDQMGRVQVAHSSTIYLPSDDPYGAQQLFQPSATEDSTGDSTLDKPEGENLTWEDWLREKLNVRIGISLAKYGNLTKECLHVAKHHPGRFVSFLLKHWKAVANKLLIIEVPCENGDLYPLGETYFLRGDDGSSGFSDINVVAKALGFGFPKSDLEFYLTTLSYIKDANRDAKKLSDVDRVYYLYSRIEARLHESVTVDVSRKMIRNAFESQSLIYIPANDTQWEAQWIEPTWCLWEAPAFMWQYCPLKLIYREVINKKYIAEFMHTTLEIPDAGINNLLDQLEFCCLGDWNNINEINEIRELYHIMNSLCTQLESDDIKKIRDRFEKEKLIYHPETKNSNHKWHFAHWHPTSKCLWSDATGIQGMVTLNDTYEGLQRFFVDILGVQTLTLEMIYKKLVSHGQGGSSIAEVKQTIWILNSYLQAAEAEELPYTCEMISSKVFPVKNPDGTVELCSAAVDFAIADRKHLAKISALSSDSHRPLTSPDRDISRKAHGLLRITAHCKSPRLKQGEQAFYELLKQTKVCESDGISSELHLNQYGEDIKVKVSRSDLHFQETKDGLTIYVPPDKRDQTLCFVDRIPAALLEWIMTEPSTTIVSPAGEIGLRAMYDILHLGLEYVAEILDRAGIVSVETVDDSADAVQPQKALERDNDARAPQGPDMLDRVGIVSVDTVNDSVGDAVSPEVAPLVEQDNDASAPRRPGSKEYSAVSDGMSSTMYGASAISGDDDTADTLYSGASRPSLQAADTYTISPWHTQGSLLSLPATVEPVQQEADLEYRRLLNKVVDVARSTQFPRKNPFNMSGLRLFFAGLVGNRTIETYRLRTTEQIERDKMIGAAGELFIFELLSSLNPRLPGFSRDSWQSTIRKYARVHDDYAGMESWNGQETADITYVDTAGVLTTLLIEKGYLAPAAWSGARPYYYLEVKTTTSCMETPFYMSGSQYEWMQRITHAQTGSEGQGQRFVYVIFRVFNVGQPDIGVRVYVDPNVMSQRRELLFTPETWTVVPGPGSSSPAIGTQ